MASLASIHSYTYTGNNNLRSSSPIKKYESIPKRDCSLYADYDIEKQENNDPDEILLDIVPLQLVSEQGVAQKKNQNLLLTDFDYYPLSIDKSDSNWIFNDTEIKKCFNKEMSLQQFISIFFTSNSYTVYQQYKSLAMKRSLVYILTCLQYVICLYGLIRCYSFSFTTSFSGAYLAFIFCRQLLFPAYYYYISTYNPLWLYSSIHGVYMYSMINNIILYDAIAALLFLFPIYKLTKKLATVHITNLSEYKDKMLLTEGVEHLVSLHSLWENQSL
ncbi:hypothetical protein WA158_000782 [Blastocystis sp. Blastoise]